MPAGPKTRDYFAEMYVAGILADNDWNVYFPRRDRGFDFIITRPHNGSTLVRPVQVKGKYPQSGDKLDATYYGYTGALTGLHPDMVLAIPYFTSDHSGGAPIHIAYMPLSRIKAKPPVYSCHPAKYEGKPCPRRDYTKYFDTPGLLALASPEWK